MYHSTPTSQQRSRLSVLTEVHVSLNSNISAVLQTISPHWSTCITQLQHRSSAPDYQSSLKYMYHSTPTSQQRSRLSVLTEVHVSLNSNISAALQTISPHWSTCITQLQHLSSAPDYQSSLKYMYHSTPTSQQRSRLSVLTEVHVSLNSNISAVLQTISPHWSTCITQLQHLSSAPDYQSSLKYMYHSTPTSQQRSRLSVLTEVHVSLNSNISAALQTISPHWSTCITQLQHLSSAPDYQSSLKYMYHSTPTSQQRSRLSVLIEVHVSLNSNISAALQTISPHWSTCITQLQHLSSAPDYQSSLKYMYHSTPTSQQRSRLSVLTEVHVSLNSNISAALQTISPHWSTCITQLQHLSSAPDYQSSLKYMYHSTPTSQQHSRLSVLTEVHVSRNSNISAALQTISPHWSTCITQLQHLSSAPDYQSSLKYMYHSTPTSQQRSRLSVLTEVHVSLNSNISAALQTISPHWSTCITQLQHLSSAPDYQSSLKYMYHSTPTSQQCSRLSVLTEVHVSLKSNISAALQTISPHWSTCITQLQHLSSAPDYQSSLKYMYHATPTSQQRSRLSVLTEVHVSLNSNISAALQTISPHWSTCITQLQHLSSAPDYQSSLKYMYHSTPTSQQRSRLSVITEVHVSLNSNISAALQTISPHWTTCITQLQHLSSAPDYQSSLKYMYHSTPTSQQRSRLSVLTEVHVSLNSNISAALQTISPHWSTCITQLQHLSSAPDYQSSLKYMYHATPTSQQRSRLSVLTEVHVSRNSNISAALQTISPHWSTCITQLQHLSSAPDFQSSLKYMYHSTPTSQQRSRLSVLTEVHVSRNSNISAALQTISPHWSTCITQLQHLSSAPDYQSSLKYMYHATPTSQQRSRLSVLTEVHVSLNSNISAALQTISPHWSTCITQLQHLSSAPDYQSSLKYMYHATPTSQQRSRLSVLTEVHVSLNSNISAALQTISPHWSTCITQLQHLSSTPDYQSSLKYMYYSTPTSQQCSRLSVLTEVHVSLNSNISAALQTIRSCLQGNSLSPSPWMALPSTRNNFKSEVLNNRLILPGRHHYNSIAAKTESSCCSCSNTLV